MIDFHPHPDPCYRCQGTAWELLIECGREDIVSCVFCGVRWKVKAASIRLADFSPEDTAEFRFQYGRFKGMTLAEAEAEPNGRRYLEHLRDTNEKLRDRITKHFDHAASSA